jgi:hypothetical protein
VPTLPTVFPWLGLLLILCYFNRNTPTIQHDPPGNYLFPPSSALHALDAEYKAPLYILICRLRSGCITLDPACWEEIGVRYRELAAGCTEWHSSGYDHLFRASMSHFDIEGGDRPEHSAPPTDTAGGAVPVLRIPRGMLPEEPASVPEPRVAIPPPSTRRGEEPNSAEHEPQHVDLPVKELGALVSGAAFSTVKEPQLTWRPGQHRRAVRMLVQAQPAVIKQLPEHLREMTTLLTDTTLTQGQIAARLHYSEAAISKNCDRILAAAKKVLGDDFPTDLPQPDYLPRKPVAGSLGAELGEQVRQAALSDEEIAESIGCSAGVIKRALMGDTWPAPIILMGIMRQVGWDEKAIKERITTYKQDKATVRAQTRGYHPRGPDKGGRRRTR